MSRRTWYMNLESLLLVAFLVNGSLPNLEAESPRYYNKEGDFSIDFPDGWETMQQTMLMATVIGRSPLKDPSDKYQENVNIVVTSIPEGSTLEDWFKGAAAQLGRMMTDYQEHEQGQLQIGGTDAKWLVYSYREGDFTIKVLTYFLVKEGRGCIITCTASSGEFEQYRSKFEEIAKSFKFE